MKLIQIEWRVKNLLYGLQVGYCIPNAEKALNDATEEVIRLIYDPNVNQRDEQVCERIRHLVWLGDFETIRQEFFQV